MHIFDALGIPLDLFLQASGELVTLSNFNLMAVSESIGGVGGTRTL